MTGLCITIQKKKVKWFISAWKEWVLFSFTGKQLPLESMPEGIISGYFTQAAQAGITKQLNSYRKSLWDSGHSGAVKNLRLFSYPGKQVTHCWRSCIGHQIRQLPLGVFQSTESSFRSYVLMNFNYGSEVTLLCLWASHVTSAAPQFPCCVLQF